MEFHVSIHGSDRAGGTAAAPFRTISRAAAIAQPGDTVRVHAGTYREWVSPANSGTEDHRIVYESAGDGEVIITGAERVTKWTDEGDGVWRTEVPNSLFTVRNPFATLAAGDWLFNNYEDKHLGEIYLDGKSLYERKSLDDVRKPTVWDKSLNPKEDSLLTWCCEVKADSTVIWANFGGKDPRVENVEINVRPFCFWPEKTGRDFITVRGFTLTQASPQWAPPTALQEGLIGPHWSRGWIIENNVISESSCCGISLGKDSSTGDSDWPNVKRKFGHQREQEVIFMAARGNWNKEHIGSHIVRYNTIHDCEQCGIVGHLGAVFSEIYSNRIYNIHRKHLYDGAEISGIKLHAALDTQIHDNIIYSSYRAVWFDWQAQGTHLFRNVFFNNESEDLFVEVCHGPYMIDHNVFLSPMNFRSISEGGAFAHNLFAGRIVLNTDSRQTPYHFPHETEIAGYTSIMGGDDRFYNNVFLRDNDPENAPLLMGFYDHMPIKIRTPEEIAADERAQMDGMPSQLNATLSPVGLGNYDDYPGPNDKFWERPFGRPAPKAETESEGGEKKEEKKKKPPVPFFRRFHLPNTIRDNLYLNNAVPSKIDENAVVKAETGIEYTLDIDAGKVTLKVDPTVLRGMHNSVVTSDVLGYAFQPEMNFELPNGEPYRFDRDFFDHQRPDADVMPGPFELTGDEIVELTF